MDRTIGMELKCINNLIRRRLDYVFARDEMQDVVGIQGPMIGYILDKSMETDVFQKDIEKVFNIRRSTATVTLQNMENKGLITREPVDYDARLKKIVLTNKAIELDKRVRKSIDIFHAEIEEGITPKEKEEFLRILDKIKNNLKEERKNDKNIG